MTIGLVRCGRIWFCPECSAAIRRGRTEELKTGALRWLAAGGTLAVVVLTARHNRTTELDRLSAALWGEPMRDASGAVVLDRSGKPRRTPGAYQRMLTDPAFYGRAARRGKDPEEGIRHRIGYAGMVRASEITRSLENGWHPHMNLLVFLGGTLDGTPAKGTVDPDGYFAPGENVLEEWEDWLRALWTRTLRRMDHAFEPSRKCGIPNCKCRGKGHGVMVQVVKSADDKALIEYLTKVQDGKPPADSVTADLDAAGGAALETVRADHKTGRGRKSVTPFQILYRLWDIESAGTDPDQAEGYGTAAECRAWWAEYEAAFAGRRAIEWTRGLRGHVQLDGDDSEERDREYVYEGAAKEPLTGGVVMTATAHGTVVGADAEMEVESVVVGEFYDSVGDLVGTLGGRADHVRVLTAEEVAAVQENLAARVLARREERERQARIAQYEADQAAAERKRRHFAGLLAQLVTARQAAGTP
ncbi:MAG TPA: replication protein [Streptomyces sp.]|nr:replication protein [Streptomyces sp.]